MTFCSADFITILAYLMDSENPILGVQAVNDMLLFYQCPLFLSPPLLRVTQSIQYHVGLSIQNATVRGSQHMAYYVTK